MGSKTFDRVWFIAYRKDHPPPHVHGFYAETAMLERAKAFDGFPRVVEAVYRPADAFLMLRLSDGRRLLVPREELSELKNATEEQAMEILIVPTGRASGGRRSTMVCICRSF